MGGVLVGMTDVDQMSCPDLHIIIYNLAFDAYGKFPPPISFPCQSFFWSMLAWHDGPYHSDSRKQGTNELTKKKPSEHLTIEIIIGVMAAAHWTNGLTFGDPFLACICGGGKNHLLFLALSCAASLSLWSSFIATMI